MIFLNVASQLIYSGSSFFLNFLFAKNASAEVFSDVSIFLIFANISITTAVVWLSIYWRDLDTSAGRIRFNSALLICFLCVSPCAALFFVWSDLLLSPLYYILTYFTMVIYVFYMIVRRHALLDSNFSPVVRSDLTRLLVLLTVVLTFFSDRQFYFFDFLIVLACMSFSFLPWFFRFFSWADSCLQILPKSKSSISLLASSIFNAVFSQLVIIIAPLFTTVSDFASSRAYDLLYYPFFLLIQSVEPFFLSRYTSRVNDGKKVRLRSIFAHSLFLSIPYLAFCIVLYFIPISISPLVFLVKEDYLGDSSLLIVSGVTAVSVALNCTFRWRCIAARSGEGLLRVSFLSASVAVFFLMVHEVFLDSGAVAIFLSRFIYEMTFSLFSFLFVARVRKPAEG